MAKLDGRAIGLGVVVDVAGSIVGRPVVFPLLCAALVPASTLLGLPEEIGRAGSYLINFLLPPALGGFFSARYAASRPLTQASLVGVVSVVLIILFGRALPPGFPPDLLRSGILLALPAAVLGGLAGRTSRSAA